ncbi:trans-sulfuration enzyme family protein [Desulfobacca acetoxidans]|uniref:L-methionine gamma-lyase n=1 Tax=Desulfobacca acetoxidans (strain ATCC 700848 / DSM 11109 / ASRB2) TaxID=880072 RepID=F2NE14_DESAR|nr:aminotransferase class I/II-fold pyridoxal phosphate-dependent enzyme [Desulfobacca acetoxidans]AEB10582.1 Cystathionine gamma-lyase [Desulfobacca acetoxidans DSM 11109]
MAEEKATSEWRKETLAVHAGGMKEAIFGEVSPPIFQTSTFGFTSAEEGAARFAGEQSGYIYTRMNNPTVNALEDAVAVLENGTWAVAAATGMAAISTVLLSLLSQGEGVAAGDCLYGPTRVVIQRELPRFGIRSFFVDTSNPELLEEILGTRPKLVFLETPANPTMKITDVAAAARLAHAVGALLIVDNTFATPYCQRPLELGADLVVHSLTKALNGHSDVLGGMIVGRDDGLEKKIKKFVTLTGATMDPHQGWLIWRGMRTLALRLERAQANALNLAEFLQNHPKVAWVSYPGLPNHPQYRIARRQMEGFGFMLSFGVKSGLEGGRILMNHLKLITVAVSLGGVESLIQHPASMTHASLPRQEREQVGLTDDLVRLSVGCEAIEDLRADLNQALNRIA